MNLREKGLSMFILVVLSLILLLGVRSTAAVQHSAHFNYLPIVMDKVFNNPSFEQGTAGWVVNSNQGDSVVTTAAARTGKNSAGLGNGNVNRLASIAQQVQVPQQAYVIQYWQWVNSPELCNVTENVVTVYVNGSPYQHYKICQDSNNSNWVEKKIYLYPFKGKVAVFKLEFNSSTTLHNYIYVDDFSFGVP